MAAPADFKAIRLSCEDEKQARRHMREMLGPGWWRLRHRAVWAGFAAEHALMRALDQRPKRWAELPDTRQWDLELHGGACGEPIRVEVKTRAVTDGWVHPSKFDYVTVPMHSDEHGTREPIKDAADLVWFCWYSMEQPRVLWVLGFVRGLDEFKRRSTWYGPKEPLPRGGWAPDGGAYVIEVKNLRPLQEGLLKELDI